MKIAVDFDGTIVEHRYPQIGEEKLFAFETLKQLQKLGHQLILWTFRYGAELEEAVEYCKKKGLEFYAVNKRINCYAGLADSSGSRTGCISPVITFFHPGVFIKVCYSSFHNFRNSFIS